MVQRCFREGNSERARTSSWSLLLARPGSGPGRGNLYATLIVFSFELGMMHNRTLQPTANALLGLSYWQ